MGNIAKDSNMTTGDNKDFHDVAFYRFVIDSLPTAVLTVNADLKITGFNPLAEKITGYSAKEAMGEVLRRDPSRQHVRCPLPVKNRPERE